MVRNAKDVAQMTLLAVPAYSHCQAGGYRRTPVERQWGGVQEIFTQCWFIERSLGGAINAASGAVIFIPRPAFKGLSNDP